ncbi:MAG: hypothetical protein M1831_000557 [Alyxoria varia]|nr:MAG: hypothetical protein M1831_000557 [Alyxoria varia]
MHAIVSLGVPLLAVTGGVSAWGSVGHQAVAFIAQNFVSDETRAWAQGILKNDSDSYLVDVAIWADSYKSTDEGSFSSPFHYIDANDKPPESCGVQYARDCGEEGCVVSAIANYTQRVQDSRLSDENTEKALKFLVHFIGDVVQPLHDEALERGGNGIDVMFDGKETNLHSLWDTGMIEKLIGGGDLSDAEQWAQDLVEEIKTGDYKDDAADWIAGADIEDAKGTALSWAVDGNKFICSTVLVGGQDAVEEGDLAGDYYKSAIPVFTEQVAKGGYRLAAWLNLLATGETGPL